MQERSKLGNTDDYEILRDILLPGNTHDKGVWIRV